MLNIKIQEKRKLVNIDYVVKNVRVRCGLCAQFCMVCGL